MAARAVWVTRIYPHGHMSERCATTYTRTEFAKTTCNGDESASKIVYIYITNLRRGHGDVEIGLYQGGGVCTVPVSRWEGSVSISSPSGVMGEGDLIHNVCVLRQLLLRQHLTGQGFGYWNEVGARVRTLTIAKGKYVVGTGKCWRKSEHNGELPMYVWEGDDEEDADEENENEEASYVLVATVAQVVYWSIPHSLSPDIFLLSLSTSLSGSLVPACSLSLFSSSDSSFLLFVYFVHSLLLSLIRIQLVQTRRRHKTLV